MGTIPAPRTGSVGGWGRGGGAFRTARLPGGDGEVCSSLVRCGSPASRVMASHGCLRSYYEAVHSSRLLWRIRGRALLLCDIIILQM